tara:strand:+ start:391 stop:717 length:327 start_codon:yes stop_codon:yes gene_type:complete
LADASWELRIHQANFDVQAVDLQEAEFKAYLDKTSWRCWAEEVNKSGKLFIRALKCNYSVESTGSFRSYASCGVGKNFDEVSVELHDERKNLDLKVILTCRFKDSENS